MYGVAVREGLDLDLFDTSATAASVTNAGVLTTYGCDLFCTGADGTGTLGIPLPYAMDGTNYWKRTSEMFGVPVTNRPVFEMGQEINEYNKAIGTPVPTAGTGYNFLKGIIAPTTSFEFDFERHTALPFLAALFQRGFEDGATTKNMVFQFQDAEDDATPYYFISAFKTQDFPLGEVISDGVVTRMVLSGSENEPLKCTFDIMGRQYSTHDFHNEFGSSGPATGITDSVGTAISVKYPEINPLMWQDAFVTIGYMATPSDTVSAHYAVEATNFELTVTANMIPVRYNSRTPRRFVVGGYTVEGSISIPYGSGTVGGTYLADLLSYDSEAVIPLPINLFWFPQTDNAWNVAPGTGVSTATMGSMVDIDDASHNEGDVHIGIGALLKGVPDENADETMLTINFTGADIREGNTVVQKALKMQWYEHTGLTYAGTRPT